MDSYQLPFPYWLYELLPMKKKNGKMCKSQRSRKTSEEYRQKVRSLIKDFMFTDGIVLIT